MLHTYVREGWPEHKRDIPPYLKSFWDVRNNIHDAVAILLKDNGLIIPAIW